MMTVIIIIILIIIEIITIKKINDADGTAPKPPYIPNNWENPGVFSPDPPSL